MPTGCTASPAAPCGWRRSPPSSPPCSAGCSGWRRWRRRWSCGAGALIGADFIALTGLALLAMLAVLVLAARARGAGAAAALGPARRRGGGAAGGDLRQPCHRPDRGAADAAAGDRAAPGRRRLLAGRAALPAGGAAADAGLGPAGRAALFLAGGGRRRADPARQRRLLARLHRRGRGGVRHRLWLDGGDQAHHARAAAAAGRGQFPGAAWGDPDGPGPAPAAPLHRGGDGDRHRGAGRRRLPHLGPAGGRPAGRPRHLGRDHRALHAGSCRG